MSYFKFSIHITKAPTIFALLLSICYGFTIVVLIKYVILFIEWEPVTAIVLRATLTLISFVLILAYLNAKYPQE